MPGPPFLDHLTGYPQHQVVVKRLESVQSLPPPRLFTKSAQISGENGRFEIKTAADLSERHFAREGQVFAQKWGKREKLVGDAITIPRTVSVHVIDAFPELDELRARLNAVFDAPELAPEIAS